jgi:glycerophosphoryl diester phosphodiesterase
MAAQLHFGPGDSIGFGTTGSSASSTASFDRSALSNMVIGDLLVVYVHSQSSSSGQTITPPSGWVQYGPVPGQPDWNTTRLGSVYYYPITSQTALNAIPSTLTWTFSASGRIACLVARATGIDLDNIEDSEAIVVTSGGGNTASFNIAGITTVNTETLLVGAIFHHNSANTSSPLPTNFMTAFQSYNTAGTGSTSANSGMALGYTDRLSTGATGTVSVTFDSTATAAGGFLVAFKAGPWTPPPPVGLAIKYTSAPDTLSDGQAFYTSATDTLSVPYEIRPFPEGYPSITAMLSESPFYVAHHGGNDNWPEMSLYAYTQSGFWGVGAFEISMARTSDGVWFGLHDDTLDRTSGTTNFIPSEHTWAEVQAYQITAAFTDDPSQPTRPYMRWNEIIDAYYSSHIIFVDPKHATDFREELLDMMDNLPGTPTDRLVAKYFGVASLWAQSARARGYKTWGYFYEANLADIPTFEGYYDYLGMEYSASQSTWDAITAYGKPVIGHIISTTVQANDALTKGAAGLMVEGVQQVIPRT